jgi:hypothetical protein
VNYISTRSENSEKKSAAFVIKQGIAPTAAYMFPKYSVLTGEDIAALAKMIISNGRRLCSVCF